MSPLENQESQIANPQEALPLSLLNDYLYCPRRAALKLVEGWRGENEHTLLGELNHEHADLPGFEHRAGWKLLRALPVWSDRLGLSGKADIVEVRESRGRILEARPVEYKSGRASRWLNDRVQLCAQALCLEEMLTLTIPEGLIFHAKSHKRTTVALDPALRQETLDALKNLRHLLAGSHIPPRHPQAPMRRMFPPRHLPARAGRTPPLQPLRTFTLIKKYPPPARCMINFPKPPSARAASANQTRRTPCKTPWSKSSTKPRAKICRFCSLAATR